MIELGVRSLLKDVLRTLIEENEALAAVDYAAAGSLANAKRQAIDALATFKPADKPIHAIDDVRSLIDQVNAAALRNAQLLKLAIDVQGELLEIVTRAIGAANGSASYARNGLAGAAPAQRPVAFIARA